MIEFKIKWNYNEKTLDKEIVSINIIGGRDIIQKQDRNPISIFNSNRKFLMIPFFDFKNTIKGVQLILNYR